MLRTEWRHFDERIAKRAEKGNNPNLRNLSTTIKKKQPTFDLSVTKMASCPGDFYLQCKNVYK